jgi:hypothetical protein
MYVTLTCDLITSLRPHFNAELNKIDYCWKLLWGRISECWFDWTVEARRPRLQLTNNYAKKSPHFADRTLAPMNIFISRQTTIECQTL